MTAYRKGDYLQAFKELDLARNGYLQAGNADGAARSWLYQCSTLFFQGDYAACHKELAQLKKYLEQHFRSPHYVWAKYYQVLGALYSDQAEYRKAISILWLAEATFGKLGKTAVIDAVNVDNLIGNTYLELSAFDSAIILYKKAHHRLLQLPKKDIDSNSLANTLGNIGAAYQYLDQWDSAAYYHKRSKQIYTARYGTDNPKVANQVYNLALVSYEKGYYDQAIAGLQQALSIYQSQEYPYHPELSEIYGSLGAVYAAKGEWDAAINSYYQDSLHTVKTFGPSHPYMAICFQEMANTRLEMGQPGEAVRLLKKALQIFGQHYTVHRNLSNCLTLLGKALFLSGQYGPARQQLQAALDMENKLGQREQSHNKAEILYWMGRTALAVRKYDQAAAYASRSLQLVTGTLGKLGPQVADNFLLLSEIEQQQKDTLAAMKYVQLAIAATLSDKQVLFPKEYVRANIALAGMWEKKGYLLSALSCIERAQREANRIRREFAYESSALDWAGQVQQINNLGVQLCYALHTQQNGRSTDYLNKAFSFAENNKAFRLHQHTAQLNISSISKISDKAIATATSLRADLIYYQELLEATLKDNHSSTQAVTKLREKIFSLSNDYDRFVRSVEEYHPAYYALAFASNAPTIEKIAEKLPKGRSLVEFHFDEKWLYIFSISPHTAPGITRVPAGPVRAAGLQMIQSISRQNDSLYRYAAARLYALTIGELPAAFHNNDLVIIADDILHDVPFEALLTKPAGKTSPSAYPYLVFRQSVQYTPSAALYFTQTPSKPKWGSSVTAFAPHFDMQRPAAFYELITLKEKFKCRIMTGKEAGKKDIEQWMQSSDLLHFATHGILDNMHPLHSFLVVGGEDAGEEQRLYAYELYRMQTKARMITLGACYSGSGPIANGEGKLNMARGFMYAGAPNIVMALWAVPDNSTGKVLSSFYSYLAKGENKAEALRLAKIDYLKSTDPAGASPVYWAGTVLIGDKYPLRLHRPWAARNWIYIAVMLLLAGGVLGRFVYGRYTV